MDMPTWLQGLAGGIPNLGPPNAQGQPQPLAPIVMPYIRSLLNRPKPPDSSDPISILSGGLIGAGGALNTSIDALTGGSSTPLAQGSAQGPAQGPPGPAGIRLPSSPIPMVNTRPGGALSAPTTIDLGQIPKFPDVPQLGTPPELGPVSGANFSAARKFAEEGRPGPFNNADLSSTNVSNVLGGLAKGAASVSATEPGSFAKALAAAGAGGAEGRGKALEEGMKQQSAHDAALQRYSMERSAQEQHMAQFSAELANAQRQTNFQNAKLIWDTKFQNEKAIYESELQRYGMELPKLTATAGGVAITKTDPQTGQMSTTIQPTTSHAEHMETYYKNLKALGGDTTPYELRDIIESTSDPAQRVFKVENKAIRRIVSQGQGAPIFGKEYEKAAKAVDTRLNTDQTWPYQIQKDPNGANEKRSQMIADDLHNKFTNSGSEEWKKMLLYSHDPFAQLAGGAQQLPPGM